MATMFRALAVRWRRIEVGRRAGLIGLLAWLLACAVSADGHAPLFTLAKHYHDDIDVTRYWVSEKLDGVRAYWNGQQLVSRGGHFYPAPTWFAEGFPPQALDGELWIGRGRFEDVLSTVRDSTPDEHAWRQVRFMVFDLPLAGLPLSERLSRLIALLDRYPSPFLQPLAQSRVTDKAQLMARLQRVVAAGGEGLMLRRADSLFKPGRSSDLLKLKPYFDAEARVVGHLPGRGKYTGKLGALLVEMPDGKRFRLGTGFSDAQRAAPPPLGAQVTYAYQGLTANGIPRFARFVRIRPAP